MPVLSRWKFDDEISIFPFAPDTNWVGLPNTNVEALIIKLDPSNVILSAFSVPICALGVPELYSSCIPVFPNVLSFIINFLFAASNLIFVPDFILSDVIVNPPIVPPSNKTSLPVIWPDADNIKLLSEDLIPTEFILKPAIVPAVFAVIVFATISPVIWAADAVICPDADRIKLLSADDIPIVLISKPAISPPSSKTLEPVIWPVAPFKFKVPPDDSKFVPILNPPIVPSWAVILPVICAADAVIWPDAPFNFNVPAAESKSSPILKPPIVPDSATILPVICAFEAVIFPDAERIKLLLEDLIPTELIVKPAIVPAVFAVIVFATISPVIFALDAVMLPEADNINLLFELFIPTELISKPAILPPSSKILEPVIWPESPLNIKLLLDDDIAVDVIANPPIWPNVAVIPPCRYTLSVAKPNPGSVFPNTNEDPANPDKSPSLAFNDTSKIADPVLSTISIYGVAWLLGFAFNLINPVPTLPVDTNTWDPE